MIHEIIYPEITTYYIAINGHLSYGIIEPDQCLTTGLPTLEQFTDKDLWITRLNELGVDNEALIQDGYLPQPDLAF